MHRKDGQQEDKQQEDKQSQTLSSFANIRAKFNSRQQSNPSSSDNAQRSIVQQDLDNLRKRKLPHPQEMSSTSSTSDVTPSSTSKKAADELATLNLGFSEKRNLLKNLLAGAPISAQNIHSEATAKELEKLGQTVSVRAKKEELEAFFKTKSQQVLTEVKVNKTSKLAEERLKELADKHLFDERQTALLAKVEQQINKDAQEYAKRNLQNEMTLARFYELSFSYRAYQVCLEQDFRRHAAETVKQKANFDDDELKILVGIPNQLAVQSLNYYSDFFKNLPEIDKIWPGAGVEIRQTEVRVIYAATIFKDPDVLYTILNDKDNEKEKRSYQVSCDIFEERFTQFTTSSRNLCHIAGYIASGNGLDMEGHPWNAYGYKRMEQPNDSIDFSKIVPVDQVHVQAMNQVNTRVEKDSTMLMKKS